MNHCAGILLVTVLLLPGAASPQTSEAEAPRPPMLLGVCSRDSLQQEPYGEWFEKNYEEYEPHAEIVSDLRAAGLEGTAISIFFGSWCGDSKREVPRFLKLLDAISFPSDQVTLIAVTNEDSSLKQSPGREERDLGIYRVPTFIVSKNGAEMHRIVEYPVLSLERDLLAILSKQPYTPNYRSFPTIARWLTTGLLEDENVSHRGLANQIRSDVTSEGELNAVGSVLLAQGRTEAAVKVFQMNCVLYPESANRYLALARGLHRHGDDATARRMLQRALELNDDPENLEPMLELLSQLRVSDTDSSE